MSRTPACRTCSTGSRGSRDADRREAVAGPRSRGGLATLPTRPPPGGGSWLLAIRERPGRREQARGQCGLEDPARDERHEAEVERLPERDVGGDGQPRHADREDDERAGEERGQRRLRRAVVALLGELAAHPGGDRERDEVAARGAPGDVDAVCAVGVEGQADEAHRDVEQRAERGAGEQDRERLAGHGDGAAGDGDRDLRAGGRQQRGAEDERGIADAGVREQVGEDSRLWGSQRCGLVHDAASYHSSSRSRRAVAEPLPGSIDTRSAASGRNEGSAVYTTRAIPTSVVSRSARLPVPPPPIEPPLTTVTPGWVSRSARCVWPTTSISGREGGSSFRTASAGSISFGSWTMITSTRSWTERIQLVKASCMAGL